MWWEHGSSNHESGAYLEIEDFELCGSNAFVLGGMEIQGHRYRAQFHPEMAIIKHYEGGCEQPHLAKLLHAEDNYDIVAFLAQWQSPLKLKAIKTAESHATILVFEESAERYGVRH